MTIYDRTDHTDDPPPPALTATEATLAHLKRQLAQLTHRLMEEARTNAERFAALERENAQLQADVEDLKIRVLPWRKKP